MRIHPLDKLISDDSLFFLEAMVPFVEFPYKKPLVLFIKYRELMCILESLNNRDYISSCGFDCHPNSTEDIFIQMCDFLPGDMVSSIKQMKQMMSMMEMMNAAQDNSHSSSPTNSTSNNIFSNNNSGKDSLFESVLSILNNEERE